MSFASPLSPPCAVCCAQSQAAHDFVSQAALERAIERAGKLKSEADARTEAMERMKALEAERAAQAQKAKDDAAAAKAEIYKFALGGLLAGDCSRVLVI